MKIENERLIFDDPDAMDYFTLSIIISDWLTKFKEVHENHPYAGAPGYYFKEGMEHTDENVEKCAKQLHEDLDRMIFAFSEDSPSIPDGVYVWQGGEVVVMDQSALDQYERDLVEWEKKVKEGRELFATLFDHLWI